jgi:non-homologous end joining protein Ku
MTTDFATIKAVDEYQVAMRKAIDAKRAGKTIEAGKAEVVAPANDITAALKASLAAKKAELKVVKKAKLKKAA